MLPHWLWPFTLITAILTLIGLNDLRQTQHSVRRNYPVIGNLRYLIEHIRPEIRQYLLEGDDDELPFSRTQRSLVYARAKNQSAEKAFGTLYEPSFVAVCGAIISRGEQRAAEVLAELIRLRATQPSDYPAEDGGTSEASYEAALEACEHHVAFARKEGFLRD
ncbi:hypothetical protein PS723_00188 [Pseudomonas fluorescens]|uniref:Uncharacterized protein n=1 Tax=Pseudomonas fluorescens TaxID=294 RepID=A0A5E6ZM25_PSEFL|nr:hypothetical protein PS723_00188 [Pseudomonas fluorescens]